VKLVPALGSPQHLHRLGAKAAARTAREQLWYTKVFLGLRCDLSALPEVRPAKVELRMEPRPAGDGAAFEGELARVRGDDYLEVLFRLGLCEDGVTALYVAGPDADPIYAQWLVREADQDLMHAHAPGRYERLAPGEVLLEGAYTFAGYRRMGAMADGMAQLLRIARDEGAHTAITYVTDDNVASLRGCAAVGFVADHVRRSSRRLGVRRSQPLALDAESRDAWLSATA
jgi:L-amino acid N-acyltransferase YncA